jgi:NO-binding membrane sensor protein with MHYT domain
MFHYLGAAAMAMLNERLFDTARSRPGKQLLSAVTAAAVANVVDRQLRRAAAAAPRRAPALLIAGSAIALGLAALAMVARRQTTRR